MKSQIVEEVGTLPEFLRKVSSLSKINKLLVVCGSHCSQLEAADAVRGMKDFSQVWFGDFTANPDYSSVVAGVNLLAETGCDAILAIGGGSALDVAKCIKLFYGMDSSQNMLHQAPIPNAIPLIAMPTTAGTGSEATRYAVIYYQGEKQSVTSTSMIPEYVFLDPTVLSQLPYYQKCATVMDAMCHAIESLWSVNSTPESWEHSAAAIRMIRQNLEGYLAGNAQAAKDMLLASNIAGRAINITQTTAGHAMCYKMTSLFRYSHGHAAALCVNVLWPYMLSNTAKTSDPRGEAHLQSAFSLLGDCFGTIAMDAPKAFREMLNRLDLHADTELTDEKLDTLSASVNPVRLKNNPIPLDKETLRVLYKQIFSK